ncbi:MAG: nucleoside hydrolase [Gemmatimonadetes bacterium]|nr:nucleoside hydrolase [Gemmatimonadota bacterium]|tara:strand:+ start:1441 stop:2373 length:933 start_codon:yes stop_codon:yes gene_type:complete
MQQEFPMLEQSEIKTLLDPPDHPVSMVLDTDTYNEIDDQFALLYALLSDSLNVEAIYAAPFHNGKSSGPCDGMERSYEEILRILNHMDIDRINDVFKGATEYLSSGTDPQPSAAVVDLLERSTESRTGPLYVVAIGAITNIATALLLDPGLVERIVVVWLGGHPTYWPTASEFNLKQDIHASQIIFDSGVPLVHVPCKNVAEHVKTTLPEIERYVKGQGTIGDYLHEIFLGYNKDHYARSKEIWDVATIAYLVNPNWVPSEIMLSPVLNPDLTWDLADRSRHPIRVATNARRDPIFQDLFSKLADHASHG